MSCFSSLLVLDEIRKYWQLPVLGLSCSLGGFYLYSAASPCYKSRFRVSVLVRSHPSPPLLSPCCVQSNQPLFNAHRVRRNRRLLRGDFGVHGLHQAASIAPRPAPAVRDPPGHGRGQLPAAATGGVRYLARGILDVDDVGRVRGSAPGRVGALPRPPAREASTVVRVSPHDTPRGGRGRGGKIGLVRRLMGWGGAVVMIALVSAVRQF